MAATHSGPKPEYVGFRLPEEDKRQLELHADRMDRSLSYLLCMICEEWLARRRKPFASTAKPANNHRERAAV